MAPQSVIVIGAGIGGLVAAALLSAAGLQVTICEAMAEPGGKLHEAVLPGAAIDAGPTVFTLRPVFERIFAEAGASLERHLVLHRLDCLARHFWEDGSRLDLFDDPARNESAIRDFAGPKAAAGFARFRQRAKRIFETLDGSFMQVPQPGLLGLIRNAGPGVFNISPFGTLWDELRHYFVDRRLRQLFARYATYCGSSPFAAPATLMLVAHAEQLGVWRVEGGMFRLATALETVAAANGAVFRYGARVTEILVANGRAAGVRLAGGEAVTAEAVVANADPAALEAGYFGAVAQQAVAGTMRGAARSLSALTWAMTGSGTGVALEHHNVFFATDYGAEFAAIGRGEMPADPTVYLCAPAAGRFFCLINAPAESMAGETAAIDPERHLEVVVKKLMRSGLRLQPDAVRATCPRQWAERFPATGGALYGRALTGWRDSFARPGARTWLPGLVLAGGGVHPGPGLPMAAISGRLAARCVLIGK